MIDLEAKRNLDEASRLIRVTARFTLAIDFGCWSEEIKRWHKRQRKTQLGRAYAAILTHWIYSVNADYKRVYFWFKANLGRPQG